MLARHREATPGYGIPASGSIRDAVLQSLAQPFDPDQLRPPSAFRTPVPKHSAVNRFFTFPP